MNQKEWDEQNLRRIAEWKFRRVFGLAPPEDNERLRCALLHVVRMLSRGMVASSELIEDCLAGKVPLPVCGYLECGIDGEHVH